MTNKLKETFGRISQAVQTDAAKEKALNSMPDSAQALFNQFCDTSLNTQVTLFNAAAINRAKRKRRILTAQNPNTGERVAAEVIEGPGKVQHASQSLAAEVVQIYNAILAEAAEAAESAESTETSASSHQKTTRLSSNNNRASDVARGEIAAQPSLAEQALRAQEIINHIETQNKANRKQQEEKAKALRQLRSLKEDSATFPNTQSKTDKQPSGLSRLAQATLLGVPRAGLEEISIDIESNQFEITTVQGYKKLIPFSALEEGTVQADLKLDIFSRVLNVLRRLRRAEKPISITNRGVILLIRTATAEIMAASLEKEPHQVLERINLLIELLKIIEEEDLETQPVPTYRELGLDASNPQDEESLGLNQSELRPQPTNNN